MTTWRLFSASLRCYELEIVWSARTTAAAKAATAAMASSSSNNVNDVQRQVDEVKGVMCAPRLSSPVRQHLPFSRTPTTPRPPAQNVDTSCCRTLTLTLRPTPSQAAERGHHAAEPRQDGGT